MERLREAMEVWKRGDVGAAYVFVAAARAVLDGQPVEVEGCGKPNCGCSLRSWPDSEPPVPPGKYLLVPVERVLVDPKEIASG